MDSGGAPSSSNPEENLFFDPTPMKAWWLLALAMAPAMAWAGSSLQSHGAPSSFRRNAIDTTLSGSLSGLVRLDGIPKPLPPLKVYKHTRFCGSHVPDERLLVGRNGELQNVVVTLHAAQPQEVGASSPRREITLDNKDCRFVPHVQAAQVGTTLHLLNSDAILHDAHAFIGAETIFNEGLPRWRKVRKTLVQPGIVKILCELHRAWMSAYIVVTPSPYFAVTDRQGSFLIDGVPAGTYSVRFWHERLGELSSSVVIEPGRTSKVEVSFESIR